MLNVPEERHTQLLYFDMPKTVQQLGHFLTSMWLIQVPLITLIYHFLHSLLSLGCPGPSRAALWATFSPFLHGSSAYLSSTLCRHGRSPPLSCLDFKPWDPQVPPLSALPSHYLLASLFTNQNQLGAGSPNADSLLQTILRSQINIRI